MASIQAEQARVTAAIECLGVHHRNLQHFLWACMVLMAGVGAGFWGVGMASPWGVILPLAGVAVVGALSLRYRMEAQVALMVLFYLGGAISIDPVVPPNLVFVWQIGCGVVMQLELWRRGIQAERLQDLRLEQQHLEPIAPELCAGALLNCRSYAVLAEYQGAVARSGRALTTGEALEIDRWVAHEKRRESAGWVDKQRQAAFEALKSPVALEVSRRYR